MFKAGLISFDEKKNYKKEEILSCITQEDIFRYYLGIEVQYKRTFKNPLRVDNHGTCGFYRNNNTIRFYDKSRSINEDCFGILNHISNLSTLSFQEKLNKIAKDLSIKGNYQIALPQNTQTKEVTDIKFLSRQWNFLDLNYWKQFNVIINPLTEDNIYPVERYYINGECKYQYKPSDPCYAYYFKEDGTKKLYFPNRKKGQVRFIGNSNVIQGLSSLSPQGEILIITKSYKDVRSLNSFGVNSIAPQSESVLIDKELFIDLYNRFDNIYTLFDWDITGIQAAKKYKKEYSLEPLFITDSSKDFTGYVKKNGIYRTNELINQFKQYYEY